MKDSGRDEILVNLSVQTSKENITSEFLLTFHKNFHPSSLYNHIQNIYKLMKVINRTYSIFVIQFLIIEHVEIYKNYSIKIIDFANEEEENVVCLCIEN